MSNIINKDAINDTHLPQDLKTLKLLCEQADQRIKKIKDENNQILQHIKSLNY